MSQVTNYNVPSSPLTMAGLKSALESIFDAIGDANRGSTAPDNPFEGMFWWDSSGSPDEILKRYTVTSGWVEICTINTDDGTINFYQDGNLFGDIVTYDAADFVQEGAVYPNFLGINDGTYDVAIPTNGMGASPKFMTGNSSTIIWMYMNAAPPGWKVLATGADTVLGVSGGTEDYNVNGGTAAGTWTQEGHALTAAELALHKHLVVRDIGGDSALTDARPLATSRSTSSFGDYTFQGRDTTAEPNIALSSSGVGLAGDAHSHGATWRPSASIGKLYQLDTA